MLRLARADQRQVVLRPQFPVVNFRRLIPVAPVSSPAVLAKEIACLHWRNESLVEAAPQRVEKREPKWSFFVR